MSRTFAPGVPVWIENTGDIAYLPSGINLKPQGVEGLSIPASAKCPELTPRIERGRDIKKIGMILVALEGKCLKWSWKCWDSAKVGSTALRRARNSHL